MLDRSIKFDNLKEMMKNSEEKFGEEVAFYRDGKGLEDSKKVTYKEFCYEINSLGTALIEMGLKGKRIAIIGENRYEWELSYLAVVTGTGTIVPLDKALPENEIESLIIRSEVEAIIYSEKYDECMAKIQKQGNTKLKYFISMDLEKNDFNKYSLKEITKKGKELLDGGNKEFLEAKINNEEMSIMLFTSGTTNQSKAVMLSHKNIASNIYAMQTCEDIRDTDTNIAFLPFHHIFGSTCIIMMIASGVKTVFPDGLRYIKKNLNEYKVTIFVGVPILVEAIYKTIMKEVEKQGKTKIINMALKISNFLLKLHIDIRRKLFKQVINALGGKLRFVISGGAPADAEISKGFNNLGIKTVQGYGLTETSPVIAAEDDKHMKNGSIGIPMCNVKLEVVNKDEEGIGEIRVKGPNVMLGYYEMPEKTKEVLKDGWFYTGDLGYVDEEGYLYITGRSKSLIVLKNGKKIFPEELETIVNRLELVSESMVFGLPDKQDKNDVKLSVKIVYDKEVVKEKYPQKTEEELYQIIWQQIKEVNKGFPRYKHIQNMILTDKELIKTTTKKVKRQEEMKSISNFA